MRNDVWTIVKKEFARFFGDKRLVFTSIIMPGLLIFVMYSFMGKGLSSSFNTSEDYVAKIYTVNMPEELKDIFDTALNADWSSISVDEVDANKNKLLVDELDAIIVFPDNFISKVEAYDISSMVAAPNIEMYYNSADTESMYSASAIESILAMYESSLSNKFDINAGELEYDQATEKETTGQVFSMMMPMLLMIFLYSGCMAVAPDSIAGEKERGTIATLLVTPMKRSSLALGKIISISVFSLLSGISSFVGTMASMPALMSGSGDTSSISASVYAVKDYVLLLLIILTTVLVFVSVLAVISAYAKSIKEAGMLVLPFMLIIMGVGISSMMGGNKTLTLVDSLIPIYGTAKSIAGIFAFNYNVAYVLIAIAVNIVVSAILTFVLTKMFDNEKIMFSN